MALTKRLDFMEKSIIFPPKEERDLYKKLKRLSRVFGYDDVPFDISPYIEQQKVYVEVAEKETKEKEKKLSRWKRWKQKRRKFKELYDLDKAFDNWDYDEKGGKI